MAFYFEDQVLDPVRRELSRRGETVIVEPKVFDLLLYLIENRHRMVTKDDLVADVWSGRVVSDSALNSAINAARRAIRDNGQEQRLIRTSARRGFRFIGSVAFGSVAFGPGLASSGNIDAARPLVLPNLPSIAVLPFQNLSADPDQDYFADGVVEDIITALSRFKSLFVIARNSSFTYKGKAVDIKQVGRELGVRYVLEGSIRKAGNHMRISGQLIESESGIHIWADRLDGPLEDVFALQDQLTARVVGAIAPKLEQAEIARAARKPVEQLDAYDCFLRGMASLYRWTKQESIYETLRLFYRSIELDPQFSTPYGMAARCYAGLKIQGWLRDQEAETEETRRLAVRASLLGQDDARALSHAGLARVWVCREYEAGEEMVDLALELNPNLAAAWQSRAQISLYLGRHEEAIAQTTKVLRLNPLDPDMARSHSILAYANLFLRRFEESLKWTALVLSRQPQSHLAIRTAIMAHALGGNQEEARRLAASLHQLDPNMRMSKMREFLPYRRPEDLGLLMDAFRRAGLPE